MGYTQYFTGLRATPEVIEDARPHHRGQSGHDLPARKAQGLPVMNEAEGVCLNGFAAAGEAYETFQLRGTEDLKYPGMAVSCRTEYRPYDQAVTAILVATAVRTISSDGGVRSDGD